MKKNLLIILIVFLFPFGLIAQKNGDAKIVITEANYKENGVRFRIKLHIENTGKDTIKVIRPEDIFFDNHFRNPAIHVIGSKRKPYHLELLVKKDCAQPLERAPLMQDNGYGKPIYVRDYNVVVIPPQEQSKDYFVTINAGHQEFCAKGEYFLKIHYEHDFELLNEQQLQFLEEKYQAMKTILDTQETYIREQELSKVEDFKYMSNAEEMLKSYYLLKTLTNTKGHSEEIELVKKN